MESLIYRARGNAAIGMNYFVSRRTAFGRLDISGSSLTLYAFPMKASLSLESVQSFSRFAEVGVTIDHQEPGVPHFLFFEPTFWLYFSKGVADLRKLAAELGLPFNDTPWYRNR